MLKISVGLIKQSYCSNSCIYYKYNKAITSQIMALGSVHQNHKMTLSLSLSSMISKQRVYKFTEMLILPILYHYNYHMHTNAYQSLYLRAASCEISRMRCWEANVPLLAMLAFFWRLAVRASMIFWRLYRTSVSQPWKSVFLLSSNLRSSSSSCFTQGTSDNFITLSLGLLDNQHL